ncbi:MAG: hypothetical protein WC069_07265 [Candidatus Shapirobacteria bacterium]
MTESSYKLWTLVFYGLQAIGTILVALLAIYGDRIIRKIFKPRLTLEINSKSPFVETITEQMVLSSETSRHIRISAKVLNHGDTTAQNCQGIIEKVFCKRKANESYYCYKNFIPARFTWNDDKESSFVTPEIPSYLEIARIQQTSILTSNDETAKTDTKILKNDFELFLTIEEPNEKGKFLKLGKGTFLFPIVFYTDNLRKTQKVLIEIYWNGKEITSLTDSDFYVKIIPNNEIPKEVKTI